MVARFVGRNRLRQHAAGGGPQRGGVGPQGRGPAREGAAPAGEALLAALRAEGIVGDDGMRVVRFLNGNSACGARIQTAFRLGHKATPLLEMLVLRTWYVNNHGVARLFNSARMTVPTTRLGIFR